jgi:hypothetical protein
VQLEVLEGAGCDKIFKEGRPELKRYLDYLREGDILLVTKIDRLNARTSPSVAHVVGLRPVEGPISGGAGAGPACGFGAGPTCCWSRGLQMAGTNGKNELILCVWPGYPPDVPPSPARLDVASLKKPCATSPRSGLIFARLWCRSGETGPGIRSEVGTNLGALRFDVASSGLGITPLNGPGSPRPRRFFVASSSRATFTFASRFL